ncbi:hypothetical protein GCM10022243_01910 [Saccharothrix violaceirubra]|uniref:Uncharacterized protein n=1 Tax=Saccharothrix violaceirubra TaxID=413306 RepID=A0A7W7T3M9_9PSEU|nr:hypothetical protein [Saccharothrix violaceirubra]MBB4965948.1 hypothetical protein [Saccharothrix violaceirubra]
MRIRGAHVLTLAMKTVRAILAPDTPLGAALTATAIPVLATARHLTRTATELLRRCPPKRRTRDTAR